MTSQGDLTWDCMRVIVADDDHDMRSLVADRLRSEGWRVLEVREGGELLDLLTRALDDPGLCPDVVLADVRMSVVTGLAVLKGRGGAHWNLPIVLMTAISDPSIPTLAKRLGAAAVLYRPFGPDELVSAVRNARVAKVSRFLS
jgi:CheY-like chemotaxis protein